MGKKPSKHVVRTGPVCTAKHETPKPKIIDPPAAITAKEMMSVMLYKTDISPPSRAVMMVMDAINMKAFKQNVNLYCGYHKTYEFTKMNPVQKVPVLLDKDHIIWDSHAIMQYVVTQYAKDDFLYPKDLKKRSQVDQLLHFDSSVLFPIFKMAAYPVLFHNHKTLMPEAIAQIEEAYTLLENLLQGKRSHLTLNRLTIADISCAATVSTLNVVYPIKDYNYPNLHRWMTQMSNEIFYRNSNAKGLKSFEATYHSLITCY